MKHRLLVSLGLALSALSLVALSAAGCTESAEAPSPGVDAGAPDAALTLDAGTVIEVPVPAEGFTYVTLATPAVVTPADPSASIGWDLAFQGTDVFTNSGPSGPGQGGGFGPLTGPFDASTPPSVPFVQQDRTGGAFLDWYAYDGTTHQLWSRYHVVGLQAGGRLFKVQLLGYYGLEQGEPTSAVYQLRYAEVTASGVGATTTLDDVDATAGGLGAPESVPSTCLDLASGDRVMLTPAEAASSSSWDLCFRRDDVGVNGGRGGPRGDGAVDLQAATTASEALAAIEAETAGSEQARFDAVTYATLGDPALAYRGDGVVSIFTGAWLVAGATPIAPALAGWLVVGADGASRYLVLFESFDGATAAAPGTIHLRVVPFAT